MAFLRFARDRRGYEHFYLIQPTTRRGKLPRLLYWFRTPPNVKVGRQPFDPAMRRALETQNPDISFDWKAIVETPIPPIVEPERWRERRRVERISKQNAVSEAEGPESATEEGQAEGEPATTAQAVPAIAVTDLAAAILPLADDFAIVTIREAVPAAEPIAAETPVVSNLPAAGPAGQRPSRGRRRRRRGRRQQTNQVPGSGFGVQGSDANAPGSGHGVPGSDPEVSVSEPAAAENREVQDSGEPEDDS